MTPRIRLTLYWLVSSCLLAALSAWGAMHWHLARDHAAESVQQDSEARFHEWVHANLNLTEAQHATLDLTEEAFAARRQALRETMKSANNALREAITRDRGDSPSVHQALDQLSSAQAALQRETLAHLFKMASQLQPAERDKLIQWTHDSLLPPP
jgi:Spy/CpxP family protein refolding chaperone